MSGSYMDFKFNEFVPCLNALPNNVEIFAIFILVFLTSLPVKG